MSFIVRRLVFYAVAAWVALTINFFIPRLAARRRAGPRPARAHVPAGDSLLLLRADPARIVRANLGRRILLAQVKDARRVLPTEGGDWELVLLGEGEVPVREMLGLLTAGGYRHWISVEWEKRWHPEIAEPEVALPQHLSVLAQWMEVNL